MALTIADIKAELNQFLDTVATNITNGVGNQALPLLGKLSDLAGGPIDPLATVRTPLLAAVDAAAGADVAQAVAEAITAAGLPGISAVKAADGTLEIRFAEDESLNTGTKALDIGAALGGFLDFTVNTGAGVTAKLNATLVFDTDGNVSLKDQADPELSVEVTSDFAVVDAHANLGVADVRFNDADPTAPEFDAHFSFDLSQAADGSFSSTSSLDAKAGLNLNFATTDVLAGFLPDMHGRFIVDFPVAGGAAGPSFGTPSISVVDVTVDLDSYLGIVGKTFGDIGEFFNSTPLGEIVDVATEPVPVLDDLAHTFGLVGLFDKVGGLAGGGDDVITIGDLAASRNQAIEDNLDLWYRALGIINILRKFGGVSAAGTINLGGGSLVGGVTVPSNDPAAIAAALKAELSKAGLPSEVTDFLDDFEISGFAAAAAPSTGSGFDFHLFEHPEDVLKILLTKQPVDLVTYDVPALSFEVQAGGFFPVLGPLGFELSGNLKAGIDIKIGLDTQGLIDKTLHSSLFITTESGIGAREADNPRHFPFLPVGNLKTVLTGGAGIGLFGSSLTVNAKFGFGLYAYFADAVDDGKFRPTADGFDCVFDPVGGRADVSVNLTLKIDFGIFDIEKNIPLASAVLADFTLFKCPPPLVEATPEAPGLATSVATELLLNVGNPARADLRLIADEDDGTGAPKLVAFPDDPATPANESFNESYVIALARDQQHTEVNPKDDPPPMLVAGKLDVYAFGFTQRFDTPAIIKADFKDGDDTLVIQRDVVVDSEIFAGAGNDSVVGGGGTDVLHGGRDNDVLSGGDGNDRLFGDDGNDQLAGGKGADLLNGGTGEDMVDYSGANKGTGIGVDVMITNAGDVFGHGGEAEGDVLISIERLVGTDYADDFRAGFGVTQNLYFEGGAGNDILIGGLGNDLLLGGVGSDHMNGAEGYDGTTYVTSWGWVDIDLQRGASIQHGGDAEGDRLFNMEAVEGSTNSDKLLGDGADNYLGGNFGDDTIEGRGGRDEIKGDSGDDLIFGGADGDTLDGGVGLDTLSYEHVAGPVTVDLGFGIGAGGDAIVMDQPPVGFARGRSSFENLIGSAAGDLLTGDSGNNRIEGRDGNDLIAADDGFDVLVGGEGADGLDGGRGIDWVYYHDSKAGVRVDLLAVGSGGTAEGDTYAAVENILGSFYADELYGSAADNLIDPNISGRAVTEFVDGRGNSADGDILRLNYSGFRADAGQGVIGGFDYGLFGAGSFTRLNAAGTATLDVVDFQNIERINVVGTVSDDTIYGGYDADRIITRNGNDTVYAGNGADVVFAGRGDDFVSYNHLFEDAAPRVDVFHLVGDRGIDTLSISLEGAAQDIRLIGRDDGREAGRNLSLSNGAAIEGFERFKDVTTGDGDDVLAQPGEVDNLFDTGAGQDVLMPGLGVDDIDGGGDFVYGREVQFGLIPGGEFNFGTLVTNGRAFAENDGDLLVLDYSGYTGATGIVGSVSERFLDPVYRVIEVPGTDIRFSIASSLSTNDGAYFGGNPGDAGYTRNDFRNIEQLFVTGSARNDFLVGTYDGYASLSFNLPGLEPAEERALLAANRRGDDFLDGGDGNDVLIGNTGDDRLFGNAGDDILIGSTMDRFVMTLDEGTQSESADDDEIDHLTGGAGADTFVLGINGDAGEGDIQTGYFYASYIDETLPNTNRAIIEDFNPLEGDVIQLSGEADFYRVEVLNAGTADVETLIYHLLPEGRVPDQLIAELKGVASFDLGAGYVHYVNADNPGVGGADGYPASVSPAGSVAERIAAPTTALLAADEPAAVVQLAAPLASWVSESNDIDLLKAALDGGAGSVGSTLSVTGTRGAVGTFDGDPFGLGKGIILSSGLVEELPGVNTLMNGGLNVTSVPIQFVKIGRAGQSDIFRADLSNLGIEIRSLTIADGNTREGGAGGIASGFDLDVVALSHTRLDSVGAATNLNSQVILPRIDAFDFSAASMHFKPGSQRPPSLSAFPNGETLDGAVNVDLVDMAASSLDQFSIGSQLGSLTLGDGGSIGFDLATPVESSGPLYLYIGEQGATGETVIGTINASPDFVEPTGDLSTDLGADGMDGDATSLTYTFTPKAGDTAFSVDVVLFTEELPEYDGLQLPDVFSFKLNGQEIGSLSNGAALTMKNLVYSASGDLIFNPVGTGPLADQIKADAYTRTITVSGLIDPGVVNTLTIEVKDGRDAFLDSGLLIKEGSFKTFSTDTTPVATADDYTVHAGRTLTVAAPGVLANDSDADGNSLTVSGTDTTGLRGVLTQNADGSFGFTPDAGFVGTTGYRYTLDDGTGNTSSTEVRIDVTNAAPEAAADAYSVHAQHTLRVLAPGLLANDSDPDGDTLAVTTIDTTGLNGVVVHAGDGSFDFTPTAGFTGQTHFRYTAGDGLGGSSTAEVTIEVLPAESQRFHIGDAPTRQTGSGGQWASAWTNPEIVSAIVHKADAGNPAEAWTPVSLVGVSPQTLAGGDIYQGDLGVSGQTLTSSAVRQEIDGTETLRFNLTESATSVTAYLSRLFAADDGGPFAEAGRIRLFDEAGNVVKQAAFHGADASGTLALTLRVDQGFKAVEFQAGVFDGGNVVFGGYANPDGSFGSAPTTDVLGNRHGSDFMLDKLDIEVGLIGQPMIEVWAA